MDGENNIFANKSLVLRGQIAGLRQANVHADVVAVTVDCNIKTVRLWEKKFRDHGEIGLLDHRRNNHRPRKTTFDQDLLLIETAMHNPFLPTAEILRLANLNVSRWSAYRRYKANDLIAARPVRKPELTNIHRAARRQYALDFANWTPEQWENVIFTDEKSFSTSGESRTLVRRPKGQRLNPDYVLPDRWSGRITSNHWGCMSGSGLIALQPLSARFDGEEYVEVLNECMEPSVREIYPDDEFPFIYLLQDNSPVHTSRNVQDWFMAHPDFLLIPHPPKSPDLNPIENVWGMMVKNWKPENPIRTKAGLDAYTREVWDLIGTKVPDLLATVKSMPSRLEQVTARDGYWIPY